MPDHYTPICDSIFVQYELFLLTLLLYGLHCLQ